MIEKLRQRILGFINSPKDVPLLAGISVGIYMMLYYYSKNFSLANSVQQLLFFTAYYVVLTTAVIYGGYKALAFFKGGRYQKHFLFIAVPGFLAFYILQLSLIGPTKRLIFSAIFIVLFVVAKWLKGYYKLLILLLFFMSLFNVGPVLENVWVSVSSSDKWREQPDDIASALLKSKPNIYYIQPDGYASFSNLKDSNHRFDNSVFEGYLGQNGFTLYPDFRSNYSTTLLSNSSAFSMKHHFVHEDVYRLKARNIIMGDNPVLKILKNNNYKTHFLSQKPYLVINRPPLGYDYCNVKYSDIPYLKDGWAIDYDVFADLQKQVGANTASPNFFFIEEFLPGHVSVYKEISAGIEGERKLYLEKVKESNAWLQKVINLIVKRDPNALIIIGADHGGFVGFEYTRYGSLKTDDQKLIKSIYGAAMAIRWNGADSKQYDTGLKTPVNLFRTVFSYLSKDKKYLEHLQDNSSYMKLDDPKGIYKYFDDKGNIVFEKAKQ